jgi:hypothetical protein
MVNRIRETELVVKSFASGLDGASTGVVMVFLGQSKQSLLRVVFANKSSAFRYLRGRAMMGCSVL